MLGFGVLAIMHTSEKLFEQLVIDFRYRMNPACRAAALHGRSNIAASSSFATM